jgi:tetratricopeptide (TPR) repeat protein
MRSFALTRRGPRVAETMNSIPSQSREELDKLEHKHGANPEGRYFVPLANAYRKVGEIDRAIVLLRQGLGKHPDYLSAHIVLGRCLADRGEEEAATAEFRHVLDLDPQNLIALRTLGELSTGAGRYEEAGQWFQSLLAVDPMNEEARRALESLATRAPAAGTPSMPQGDDLPQPALVPDQLEPAISPQSDASIPLDVPASTSGTEPGAPMEMAGGVEDEAVVEVEDEAVLEVEDEAVLEVEDEAVLEVEDEAEVAVEEFGFGEESEAVVTETIAELYTRQGVYDRAAEVYRELLRQRGPDAGLEQRLRRVEAMARGEMQEGDEVDLPAPEVGEEDLSEALPLLAGAGDARPDPSGELADPFADSFQRGFPDPEPDEPSADELPLLPWTEQPPEQEVFPPPPPFSASTIRGHLRQVLSWTPGVEPDAFHRGVAAPAEAEGRAEEEAQEEPATRLSPAGLEPDFPSSRSASPMGEAGSELQPAQDEHGVLDGWSGAPAAAEDAESDRLFGSGETETIGSADDREGEDAAVLTPAPFAADDPEELFPWEMPIQGAGSDAPGARGAGAERTLETEGRDFDRSAPSEPEPQGQSGPAAESRPAGDDEDDLKSFQAWLRSLKR